MINAFENTDFQKSRLSSQVKDVFKKAIQDGEIGYGEKLPSENQLAKMLQVSSVTLREALRELETEGLIEKRRGIYGGSFVVRPGPEKMVDLVTNYYRFGEIEPEELAELRQILEPSLAALAAERRTVTDLRRIALNIKDMEKEIAKPEPNRKVGLEFHRLVAEACHNRFISTLMSGLVHVFFEILEKVPMTGADIECDLDYSRKIYQALRDRKNEEARQLMMDHFEVLFRIIERKKKLE